jgi:hypothetical protein
MCKECTINSRVSKHIYSFRSFVRYSILLIGSFYVRYLYDIFSNKNVIKHNIPALIACNKSDMITALPPERIQTMLEIEMYVIVQIKKLFYFIDV